jgi:hypothetical protein
LYRYSAAMATMATASSYAAVTVTSKKTKTNANAASPSPPPPPLTLASSYTAVPANFAEPGWEQKLRDAGHDGRQPPVWVLEGLLYYLAPDAVQRILRLTAALSAPGSVLVASEGPYTLNSVLPIA